MEVHLLRMENIYLHPKIRGFKFKVSHEKR